MPAIAPWWQVGGQGRAKFFTGFFNKFFGVTDAAQPVSDELLRWAHGIAMQAGLKPAIECMRSFSGTDFRGDLACSPPIRTVSAAT